MICKITIFIWIAELALTSQTTASDSIYPFAISAASLKLDYWVKKGLRCGTALVTGTPCSTALPSLNPGLCRQLRLCPGQWAGY
jgi:hypothetical protein